MNSTSYQVIPVEESSEKLAFFVLNQNNDLLHSLYFKVLWWLSRQCAEQPKSQFTLKVEKISEKPQN